MNSRLDELTAQSTWTDAEIAEYEGLFAELTSRFFHFLSHNASRSNCISIFSLP